MIDLEDIERKFKENQNKNGKREEQSEEGEEKKKKNANKGKVVGNYILGRDLGKGTFGEVMVGTHQLTNEKVAIKVLEKDKIVDVHDVERVTREIHILKIVRHPTIVQLYEIIETEKELYLIMEYARGGELFEYIVNRKRVKERDACKFLHQILSGVDYLHKLGICHRDLKPENLLMDDFNNIKIVDFGLSNTYKPGESLNTACGSPCYAAPEMVAGKKYDGQAADMWSVGVIIYAMVCGFLPFEDPKTNKLYNKIINAEFNIPEFVSESCQELIRNVLSPDPKSRMTIEGIRNHSWY
jgi:5'-AMP-activated protein kinase catalytic alpha subunit